MIKKDIDDIKYYALLRIIALILNSFTIINIEIYRELYKSIIIRSLFVLRIILLDFIILILINILAERLLTI